MRFEVLDPEIGGLIAVTSSFVLRVNRYFHKWQTRTVGPGVCPERSPWVRAVGRAARLL